MTTSDTSPHSPTQAAALDALADVSSAAQPRREESPALPATRPALMTVEHLAYLAIAVLSVLLHFWALGERALHHDETLHASYSWFIFVGNGYIHDPLLHGPFLYYFGALMYFLFGDNDYTARLGAALFGTVLPLLPFLVRRELGRPAALIAAVYLLLSPTFLYVGRFIRHDIYSIVFELLVFVAIVRYASTRRAGWLYLGAAAFGLMYANQETSYLFVLMLGTPLVLLLLWRAYKPGIALVGGLGLALALLVFVLPGTAEVEGNHTAIRDPDTGLMQYTPGPLFGWYPLETDDNSYALTIRNRADTAGGQGLFANLGGYLADVGRFLGHPAVLIGIGLLLACSALLVWQIWLRRNAAGLTRWQHQLQTDDGVLAVYDTLWHQRRIWVALAIFLAIYALLFTAFFTNLIGVISGTTGSLLYWLAQHNVERGGQPPYYYLLILFVYEPLLVLWASVGLGLVAASVVRALRSAHPPAGAGDDSPDAPQPSTRPSPALLPTPGTGAFWLALLMVWWSLTALGIYSWAGEKMPWLTVHVALPQVLLGAWALQRVLHWAFARASLSATRRGLLMFGSAFFGVLGLAYIHMTILVGSFPQVNDAEVRADGTGALIILLALALLALLVLATGLLRGWRWSLGALALCVLLTGSLYTIRSAYRATYVNGDVPRELLIYTQTSPDVPRIVRRLEAISQVRTNGLEMPIIYDNETVWQWYLRDFTNANRAGPALSGPPDAEVQAVLMLQENLDRNPQNRTHLEDAGFVIQRYPLRWWLPEDPTYQKSVDWRTMPLEGAPLLTRVMRAPLADQTIVDAWNFLLFRDVGAPLGSSDFVIAVRPGLADQIGPGLGAE